MCGQFLGDMYRKVIFLLCINYLDVYKRQVETYTSGASMLQSLLRELAKARQHIHIEFYIFEDDAIGRMVRDVLIEKVRAGVEVRVIYDDVGCWHVPNRFYDEMRSAGIEVRSFLKVRFPLFTSKVNSVSYTHLSVQRNLSCPYRKPITRQGAPGY